MKINLSSDEVSRITRLSLIESISLVVAADDNKDNIRDILLKALEYYSTPDQIKDVREEMGSWHTVRS